MNSKSNISILNPYNPFNNIIQKKNPFDNYRTLHLSTDIFILLLSNVTIIPNIATPRFNKKNLWFGLKVRGILAQLGYEKMDDMIGRTELLRPRDISIMKTQHLDLSYILSV